MYYKLIRSWLAILFLGILLCGCSRPNLPIVDNNKTEEGVEEPSIKIYEIGDLIEGKRYSILMNYTEETGEIFCDHEFFSSLKPEGKFVLISLSITNTTKEFIYVSSFEMKINSSNEKEYSPYSEVIAAQLVIDEYLFGAELAPNETIEAIILFDIPEDLNSYYFSMGNKNIEIINISIR